MPISCTSMFPTKKNNNQAVDALLRAARDLRLRLRDETLLALLMYVGVCVQETCDDGEVTSLMDRFPPRRRVPNYALCRLTRVSTICGRQPQTPTPSTLHRATNSHAGSFLAHRS